MFKENFIYDIVLGVLFTSILIIQFAIIKEKKNENDGIYQTLRQEQILNYKVCFEKEINKDNLNEDLGNDKKVLIIYHNDITKRYCKTTDNLFYDDNNNYVFKNITDEKIKDIEYYIYNDLKDLILLNK